MRKSTLSFHQITSVERVPVPNLSLEELLIIALVGRVFIPALTIYFNGLSEELLALTKKRLRRRPRKRQ